MSYIIVPNPKGGFCMKNMNRIEIKEFTEKYFPEYIGDIHRVSYFDYNGIREYLVNSGIIFLGQL